MKNDNVFGDTGDANDDIYLGTVGWSGNGSHHNAKALINSENITLGASCGSTTWSWGLDYAYSSNQADAGSNWLSGVNGTDGTTTNRSPQHDIKQFLRLELK